MSSLPPESSAVRRHGGAANGSRRSNPGFVCFAASESSMEVVSFVVVHRRLFLAGSGGRTCGVFPLRQELSKRFMTGLCVSAASLVPRFAADCRLPRDFDRDVLAWQELLCDPISSLIISNLRSQAFLLPLLLIRHRCGCSVPPPTLN